MLQRIQTIWLLLAVVCVFLTMQFSTYSGTNAQLIPGYFLKGTENLYFILVTLAIGLISAISIFLYKNRKLQLRLVLLCVVLELGLLFLYYKTITTFTGGTYSLAALLHIAVILFLIFAARGIRADDKLIKESSRLR